MSPEIKTELHIPDLWYDFYARFLPGITFIGAVRVLILSKETFPDFSEMIALIFLGYVSALITQPFASTITGLIQKKDRTILIKKLQQRLGEESRQTLILGKMHAEVTFFVQLAILTLVALIAQLVMGIFWWPITVYYTVFSTVMLINASNVASRRFKRAQQLEVTAHIQTIHSPKIIVFSGPPCSGKSTLANELSARMGYSQLQMDEIREFILPESRHEKKDREVSYRVMHLLARYLLQNGLSVIVDATYGPSAHRSQLESIALDTHAQLFLIECKIDPDVAVSRFNSGRSQHPAIDLTPERVRNLAKDYPYFGEGLTINSTYDHESCLRKIDQYILYGSPIRVNGEWSKRAIKQ